MKKLTEKEELIYKTIKEFITTNGYSPSMRELCKLTKIKSTASISNYLESLKDKGYITYIPNKNRTVRVIEK